MAAAAAARMKNAQTANIAVIGDEDTVTGFLLAGVGAMDGKKDTTYLIVTSSASTTRCCVACRVFVLTVAHALSAETKQSEIEASFTKFSTSPDIGILLISQPVRRLDRKSVV